MNVITAIELEKIVYFKQPTRFEFTKGLTFVQGRNLQRRGPSASNGSGKSLLFGVLPNLLFDSHPTITKNTRSVQRQLYGKGSTAAVHFQRNKHKYSYTKAGSKTTLSRDGKNLESRIARDQMRKLVDLSEEEFFSTVYLDSRRNNQFQLGTSADRFAFITELFRLHELDDIRKHINRSITELNSDGRLLEQTTEDLADVQSRLAALPKSSSKEAEELAAWLQTASTKVQRLTATQHQWENWSKYQAALDELATVKRPARTINELSELIEAHVKYDAQVEAQEQQQRKFAKWHKELAALDEVDAAQLQEFERARRDLRKADKPSEPTGDLAKAKSRAQKLSREKAERIAQQSASLVRVLTKQLEEFDSEVGDADTCPTCHSTLTAKTKAAVRERFTADIDAAKDKQRKAKLVVEAHDTVDEHAEYSKSLSLYNEYVKARKAIDAYPFEDARRKLELVSLLGRASESASTKPRRPEGSVKELQAELKQARRWKELDNAAKVLRCEKPDSKVDAKQIDALNAEVTAKMSKLPELQAVVAERRALRKQVSDLDARKDEISTKVEDLPVYKLLSDAYSVKGIKVVMVKRIAAALEKNLNRYSRQIFAEDFRFKFGVEDNKFDVWVTRRMAKGEVTSDIRHMSGAESRLFIFLFVLSLLPLIPDSRRMNILVLDEPDANMDPDTREIFRDSLLPRLAKVVPSVVVISPNKDIVPHHSRVFTVVKNKGESRLVEGFA